MPESVCAISDNDQLHQSDIYITQDSAAKTVLAQWSTHSVFLLTPASTHIILPPTVALEKVAAPQG